MWYKLTLWFPPRKTKSGCAAQYEYDARAVSVVGVALLAVVSFLFFFFFGSQSTGVCAERPAQVRTSRSAVWLSVRSSRPFIILPFACLFVSSHNSMAELLSRWEVYLAYLAHIAEYFSALCLQACPLVFVH